MDSIESLVHATQDLTLAKYLMISIVTLTLYDFSLTFDDELRYIWRNRKTWISYLYILNRILLVGYQLWIIFYTSGPRDSKIVCLAGYYIQAILIMFFMLSSDLLVTLRVYVVSFKNKLLALYFGALMLARMAMSLATSILNPPAIIILPPIPIGSVGVCPVNIDLRFMLIPNSIGTVFELSAFVVIVWYTSHLRSSPKFSALVHTIITEATIYFLVMVAMQTYVLLSLIFMEGTVQQLSFLAYGSLNPILTMKFVVSLKRSANQDGQRNRQSARLSLVTFAVPLSNTRVSATYGNIEMGLVEPPNAKVRTRGPWTVHLNGRPLTSGQPLGKPTSDNWSDV